jgi:hypothetical protein
MKGQDRTGTRYSEAQHAVADEGMGEEEAMDFLSDEERAAIGADDEDDDNPADAGQDDSDQPPNEGQSDEDEGRDEGSEADGQQQQGSAEASPEQSVDQQEAEQDGDVETGLDDPPVPKYNFDAADLEERQTKLNNDYREAKALLEKRFEDGELDETEYRRRKDAVEEIRFEEQRKLDKEAIKAEIAREFTQQSTAQSWDHALARFMSENKEIRNSRSLTGAMQAELNAIGEEFAGKPLSYPKMLEMAKTRVYKDLGREAPQADRKVTAVKALAKQRGGKPEIPKTLGDVPADKMSSDKFDDIEALSGLAYEDAIARMTGDELSQWSR